MKYISVVIFSLFTLVASAQVQRELAEQAMEEGRFEDALDDFTDLYYRSPNTGNYESVLECYIALKDWRKGERFIQKHIENSRSLVGSFKIDRGYFLQNIPDTVQAELLYNEVLEEVFKQSGLAYQYSERAKKWGLYKLGLAIIETATDANPTMNFDNQKALLYAEMGQLENMYTAYLDALERNPNFRSNLENIIRFNMDREGNIPKATFLKSDIIQRIQAGGTPELNKLLVWILVQEGEFNTAFTQQKALYLREEVNAHSLLIMGQQAVTAKEYRAAKRFFTYLIERGSSTPYLPEAQHELLKVELTMLREKRAEPSEFEDWMNSCRSSFPELRGSSILADLYKLAAEVEFYDLHNNDSALAYVAKCVNSASPRNTSVIESQLLKGDIELAMGLPYDAILTYASVEADHGSSPLGQEARFRKGKVAFFVGNFEWALTTFNVLKASTSKLIANDAMRYSLTIKDNAALDTTYTLLEKYASVMLLMAQNKLPEALLALDTLDGRLQFAAADHPLLDESLFTRAEILQKERNYPEAVALYLRVADEFSDDLLADEALMRAADIEQNNLRNSAAAKDLYERILIEHGNSIFAEQARVEFRKLRGDQNT